VIRVSLPFSKRESLYPEAAHDEQPVLLNARNSSTRATDGDLFLFPDYAFGLNPAMAESGPGYVEEC